MGLGLEVYFVFDVEESHQQYIQLREQYNFDHRNGLNLIMTGEDAYDAGDDEMRLLRQIEKILEIDLGILDFWEEYEEFIEIEPLRLKLIELETALVKNTDFYKKICWGKDIEDRYLKNNFVMDVRFLIERLNLNIKNGASKVKYISY
ncbi:hypothetical protein SAMN05443633_101540 [Chryseobacterium arachidis]|uniref:Uncharacterized protein n=1 Tax=Chryseobacterium arachidis TaxID=1416778 RepID=A0A1M4UL26_9FLAO|nr:hypothetical protein [Chryseobacterium arachidis]SHE57481.1 hypothetical protein SAMN05443633_101540 [Chryseobacterium arachidis]